MCGLGAALLSTVPVVAVGCCLWMLGAGALSVWFYRRQVPGVLITPGMGMKIGALAGVFGFIGNAILTSLSFAFLRSSGALRSAMEEQMTRQMAGNSDPKVQEMMHNMLDWMTSPQGAATMIVMIVLVLGVMFVLLCAAGGALGASMSGPRREFR